MRDTEIIMNNNFTCEIIIFISARNLFNKKLINNSGAKHKEKS